MNNTELLKIPECEKIGIYAIRNTKNNKMYIGSSKNIKQRTQQHKRMLLDFHGASRPGSLIVLALFLHVAAYSGNLTTTQN